MKEKILEETIRRDDTARNNQPEETIGRDGQPEEILEETIMEDTADRKRQYWKRLPILEGTILEEKTYTGRDDQ